jgi:hypothetical protein
VALAVFLVLTGALAARAEEGGVGHYAPGSFASFVDVPPSDPSLGVFNYFVYYGGDAGASRPFPIGGQIALNVDATSYADSFGAFWATPLELFGARYSPGVAIPYFWNTVSAQVTGPLGNSVTRSDSVSGLGDIELFPVALGWTLYETNLHVSLFGGIYTPSGEYEAGRLANLGLNYWTFEPGLLISYFGQKNGIEFTTYIGYDVNTKNTTTDYQSGQQFHIDATLAQHFPLGKGFAGVGANGFILSQTSGDSGSGAKLGSFEEATAGIGPVLSYVMPSAKTPFAIEVKWLPQLQAQNTVKGNYVWVKLGIQF